MNDLTIVRQTDHFRSELLEQTKIFKSLFEKDKAKVGKQVLYDKVALRKYKEAQDITVNRLAEERDEAICEKDIYRRELEKTDTYSEQNVKSALKDLRKDSSKQIIISNERTEKEFLRTLELLKKTNQK
jgi:hypothetical protein